MGRDLNGSLDVKITVLGAARRQSLASDTQFLPLLKTGRFMRAFLNKGRFAGLLSTMPVHIILHPEVALLGAAYLGLEGTRSW